MSEEPLSIWWKRFLISSYLRSKPVVLGLTMRVTGKWRLYSYGFP
jgi:hypothetical protein